MLKSRPYPPCSNGYSLVEVVIAGFILVTAITAAALLANNLVLLEENNLHSVHAINLQEQSAKLYALGLEPTNITNILAEALTNSTNASPGRISFLYSTNGITNISGIGDLETVTNTVYFSIGTDNTGANTLRSNSVFIVRPTIR